MHHDLHLSVVEPPRPRGRHCRPAAAAAAEVLAVPADDAAGDPGAGVARLLALGVAALAHVVGAGVDDDSSAHYGVLDALLETIHK